MDLSQTVDSDSITCSIDIGAATSSVSFIYAKSGDTLETLRRKVYHVDTWPHHHEKMIDIPTFLCYRDGQPILEKMGANATRPRPTDNWGLVEAFKRHVNRLGSNDVSPLDRGDFEPFPEGVTLNKVYEDWIRFLFESGAKAFRQQHSIPDSLWSQRILLFVEPNGWNEPEQSNVRPLVRRAGAVAHESYVRFARESEATLHYCLFLGLAEVTQPKGLEFFVCNSGASTTDIGFYRVTSVKPLHFEEVLPAISFEAGSSVAQEVSAAHKEDTHTDTDDTDVLHDPIELIIEKLHNFQKQVSTKPKFLVLGGGYSRNLEVQERLREDLQSFGIAVIAPLQDATRVSPTVDGGLFSCLHNFVQSRASAYTYGTDIVVRYNASDKEHQNRSQNGFYHHAGTKYVKNGWSSIVTKGERIRDGETRTKRFTKLYNERPHGKKSVEVKLYATTNTKPQWVFESDGKTLMHGVRQIAVIEGDLDVDRVKVHEKKWGSNNASYEVNFQFNIDFGSVTSRAQIVWKGENGETASEPATFRPPLNAEAGWATNDW